MRRQRWFELHDQPWFPGGLRDLVTEALEAVWNRNGTYRPIAARLRDAVAQSGVEQIVDLCSGGGGPWLSLYPVVADGRPLGVTLTDQYPSALLGHSVGAGGGVTVWPEPVDARRVPAELRGLRTIFSSFHHFDPAAARAILADAFARREGIGVFEAARPNLWTMVAVAAMPVLSWQAAAGLRPFRWKRFVWTYLLPVVPAVLWVDGVLSCLRSYTLDDLRELTAGLTAEDYAWEIGDARGGRVPIRYVVGRPGKGTPQGKIVLD